MNFLTEHYQWILAIAVVWVIGLYVALWHETRKH